MKIKDTVRYIEEGKLDYVLAEKLGIFEENLEKEKARILSAVDSFASLYGAEREISVFSVGGRSEISGNHTDHNAGRVIAASVNLSVIAIASARNDGIIRIKSEGFDEDVVSPEDALSPDEAKRYKSSAIIAGIENAFIKNSLRVGGFDAFTV